MSTQPAYDDLPPSPYAGDWSFGAFAPPGVIWLGDIPLPTARDLVNAGWTVLGEPLPAPEPEPAPAPTPQPEPTPFPDTPPANDPVVEPRTPIPTPEPEPLPEPTVPRPPILEPPVDLPPGRPGLPPVLPPIIGDVIGSAVILIGGTLYPSDLGNEPDVREQRIPRVDIPPPAIAFPDLPPLPEPAPPELTLPEPPDVVIVTPSSPPYSPPIPSRFPLPNIGAIAWPIIPIPSSRRLPLPRSSTQTSPQPSPRVEPQPSPQPVTPPQPITPPLPVTPPTERPPSPPVAPPVPPTPLTPPNAASVESAPQGEVCETPSQTRERRARQREECGNRFIRIKVKAHYRKVCVSQFLEHEARRRRKQAVRKYITKPAGELGRRATDWLLKEVGLTPYAEQAKDIKKRVRDLTKKQKRYRVEIPGTHGEFDPVDLIPHLPKDKP